MKKAAKAAFFVSACTGGSFSLSASAGSSLRSSRMPAALGWAMRREMMSAGYTTSLDQLMRGTA
ncbi:DUF4113 domain-containing protein [Pseudomonas sp. LA21]|uniref:DUF4113 domain-containing protein n=1 Tax=Pseudomonas sp. LA21 TaxID=2893373 RepID=UPI0032644D80